MALPGPKDIVSCAVSDWQHGRRCKDIQGPTSELLWPLGILKPRGRAAVGLLAASLCHHVVPLDLQKAMLLLRL